MITFANIGRLGRLGNQMFQMASTLGIGRKLGYDVKFPREVISDKGGESPDSYSGCKLQECFDIPEHLIESSETVLPQIKFRYSEGDFRYNQQTELLPDGCDLYGYFQTEKYFKNHREEVLSIFKFKKEIIEKAESLGINIKENYVSLHVRRGDYLSLPQHHPTQDMEYYQKAMSNFDGDSIFCLFSDDLSWCKENFKGDNFIFMETSSPYVDLYLMSNFKNHIIANSSFSWWGSWLSNSQKTIAPIKWFGPMLPKETSDVYCQDWISI
jgi:hypothetical protein